MVLDNKLVKPIIKSVVPWSAYQVDETCKGEKKEGLGRLFAVLFTVVLDNKLAQ